MSYEDGVKTIVIGEGITSILDEIFNGYAWGYNCYFENLTTVKLPSTLKSIGGSAFSYIKTLKTITLGNGLETIPGSCFSCSAITSIKIPASVKKIGGSTVIKLSKKLKKNMKITVKVTKSGYTKRTKTIKIK